MSTTAYLDGFLEQLLTARKSHYSEDSMNFYLEEDRYIIEDVPQVKNQWQERLKCTLVRHRTIPSSGSCRCIVYLHGMGSTRLESLSVVQCMPANYCLCMFDMSGSGKSQGELTTYGIKECEDIEPVITHLSTKLGIREFVLWGRSMGAVAALLYVLQTASPPFATPNRGDYLRDSTNVFSSNNRQKLVKAIVLDSPFHNFRDIVKEKAINNFSVPSFLADTAAGYIQSSFSRILSTKIGDKYNPFLINFTKQINLTIPIIMVYSEKDEVVPASHSQRLIKNIRSKFQKILINECNHNEARPNAVLSSIFDKLDKYGRARHYESRRFSTDKQCPINQSSERKRGIFVFTPSKEKEFRTSTQFIKTERKFIQPPSFNLLPNYQYSSIKQSPKSAVLTPRRTKLSLQSSQMFTRNAKEEERQTHIATIDTQTNSLISKKLVGVPESDGKSKILRSMRFNMDKRRQVKLGRQRYLQ